MNAAPAETLAMRLLIVWHSRTGAAQALARAAFDGAGGDGGACLLRADEVTPEAMLAAGGYIFAAPENLAALSGEMKEMFDRCYYPLLGRIEGRGYATMIAAGSDGRGAQAQIDRIVTGWRLRRVADAMIVNLAADSPEAICAPKTISSDAHDQARALGAAMREGLRLGIF